MDQNCSQSPNTEVGRRSPSKPRLEIDEVGKLSPNDRAESPDTNCAICLGKLQNKSFTDSCLHQFCFNCLLEWSKVKAECPLCKQSFKSIIHNVRSIEDYDQYHLRPSEQHLSLQSFSYSLSSDDNQPRFRYRTTMVNGRPLHVYLQRLEHMMSHGEIIPPGYLTQHHRWLRRSGSHNHASSTNSGSRRPRLESPDYPDFIVPGTSGFRRHIYNSNLWVRRVPDLTGRFRECSAEFFLNNPAQVHRLVPWLNRELNVLLHGTDHQTPDVVAVILDLLPRYNIRSQEFRTALLPYLRERTDHFIHEFYAFGTSPYDMVGYDRICLYGPRFQFSDNDLSDSSSDSDIQVVDMVQSESAQSAAPANVPSHDASHPEGASPVAGPSHGSNNQSALVVVSSGEDSDSSDCEIVGAVKPRHLRTPEVITLSDSDSENGVVENYEPENEYQVSEESEGEVDYKPMVDRKTMFLNWHHNCVMPRSLSVLSSSDESSGEEWGPQQRKSSLNRKHKREKKEQSSPRKKVKDKEPSRKKKSSKDKKSKTVKHWKKKLCRKIESSSSSDEPFQMKNRKRRILSSSSSSDLKSDHEHRVDHDYFNSCNERNGRRGHVSRLKSVVHVRRDTQESNDTPLRNSDRGPSISSATSSRCSTNRSLPTTSSRSANYTACMIPNGDCNPRILLRRNRKQASSVSSSCSSSSSSSPSTSYPLPHKYRHRKVKSKRKRT